MKQSKCLIQTKSEDFGSVSSRRGGTGFPGSIEVGGSMKWHFLIQNGAFYSKFNIEDRTTDPKQGRTESSMVACTGQFLYFSFFFFFFTPFFKQNRRYHLWTIPKSFF